MYFQIAYCLFSEIVLINESHTWDRILKFIKLVYLSQNQIVIKKSRWNILPFLQFYCFNPELLGLIYSTIVLSHLNATDLFHVSFHWVKWCLTMILIKTSHIENSQFSIETLILPLLQLLCSLISRFILSFAVFFFCLFHVFYINLEVHIVSYLK